MKNNIFTKFVAVGALVVAASSAQATIIGVQEIKITSALPSWLQVAEVYAYDESGTDLAVASLGATTLDNGGNGHYRSSSLAIDGNADGAYPNIFHSSGSNMDQFMTVILSDAFNIDAFSIGGRTDYVSNRDVYNVSFLDAFGSELYSLSDFAANQTVQLPNIGNAQPTAFAIPTTASVPEPAGLALLGLGLLALGLKRKA